MCLGRNINGNRDIKFLECDYLLLQWCVKLTLVKVLIMSRLKCYQIFFYFILFASEKASKLAIKIKQNSGSTFMGFKLVFVIKKSSLACGFWSAIFRKWNSVDTALDTGVANTGGSVDTCQV